MRLISTLLVLGLLLLLAPDAWARGPVTVPAAKARFAAARDAALSFALTKMNRSRAITRRLGKVRASDLVVAPPKLLSEGVESRTRQFWQVMTKKDVVHLGIPGPAVYIGLQLEQSEQAGPERWRVERISLFNLLTPTKIIELE